MISACVEMISETSINNLTDNTDISSDCKSDSSVGLNTSYESDGDYSDMIVRQRHFVKRPGKCPKYRCDMKVEYTWMFVDTLSSNYSSPDDRYSSHSGDGDISSTSTPCNKQVKTYKVYVPAASRICDEDSNDDST